MDPTQLCTLCNLQVCVTLRHLLLECPIFKPFRQHYIEQLLACNPEHDDLVFLLNTEGVQFSKVLLHYITSSLRLRAFIMAE